MKSKCFLFLIWILLASLFVQCRQMEKPNILWLVIEDTSPYLFPAYGNTIIKTPNLDFLAENGVVFTNTFATGPQCSPARSSLISGCDATTYGTDVHRQGRPVPSHYFFPPFLRENGYYTSNYGKTDYNIPRTAEDSLLKKVWNHNGRGATYNDDARRGRPFFAMFNDICTHMSRMTTVTLDVRKPCRISVDDNDLPPHVPDLPESRADYALHLESIEDCDKWVGLFLDDLRERKLLKNTIIFFFSDHGGCLPRGKAFPYDTGFRAAFIAYVPPKWQHLMDEQPGSRSARLITFTDFGPTALSLAGINPPSYMQGEPFMGEYRTAPAKYAHTFRTNTSNHFDPSRSVYDGRYHYIRNYTPYKIHGLRQGFQWGMPAQLAWDYQFHFGGVRPEHRQYYQRKPAEMLFDLQTDPWELHNLASEPALRSKLEELREETSSHMYETGDLGFFPRSVRAQMEKNGRSLYDVVHSSDYPLHELLGLVEMASDSTVINPLILEENLDHTDPAFRFWAASGFVYLYCTGMNYTLPAELFTLVKDKNPSVAATAAEALIYGGEEKTGLDALVSMCIRGNGAAASALEEVLHHFEPEENQVSRLTNAYEKRYKGTKQGFALRSILINQGLMPMDSLFVRERVEKFIKDYKHRISTWAPTAPNTEKKQIKE